jgi:chemotaxis signal transduction protein
MAASSQPSTRGGRSASAGSVGSALTDATHAGWCVFDLDAGRFALDVRMVGEVVAIDRAVTVPRAPRGVVGLFNLRGAAVALVDLSTVLEMPVAARARTAAPLALVLRSATTLVAAIRVDAVIAVIGAGTAFTAADRGVDHAAVAGFVTTPSTGTVSVLDAAVVHQRLATLRAR